MQTPPFALSLDTHAHTRYPDDALLSSQGQVVLRWTNQKPYQRHPGAEVGHIAALQPGSQERNTPVAAPGGLPWDLHGALANQNLPLSSVNL